MSGRPALLRRIPPLAVAPRPCDGPERADGAGVTGATRPPALGLPELLRLARALAPAARSVLRASLEAIPAAAVLLRLPSTVVEANAAAEALLQSDRAMLLARIRGSVRTGRRGRVAVTKLGASAAGHVLAVISLDPRDLRPWLAAVSRRWRVTERQQAVLALVVRGLRNRAIARSLRCSEGTVERHVSALLAKAECESRAEIVARFWSSA